MHVVSLCVFSWSSNRLERTKDVWIAIEKCDPHFNANQFDLVHLIYCYVHRNPPGPVHVVNVPGREQQQLWGGGGQDVGVGRLSFHTLERQHLWRYFLWSGRVTGARTPQESQQQTAQHTKPPALRRVWQVLRSAQSAEATSQNTHRWVSADWLCDDK